MPPSTRHYIGNTDVTVTIRLFIVYRMGSQSILGWDLFQISGTILSVFFVIKVTTITRDFGTIFDIEDKLHLAKLRR